MNQRWKKEICKKNSCSLKDCDKLDVKASEEDAFKQEDLAKKCTWLKQNV